MSKTKRELHKHRYDGVYEIEGNYFGRWYLFVDLITANLNDINVFNTERTNITKMKLHKIFQN